MLCSRDFYESLCNESLQAVLIILKTSVQWFTLRCFGCLLFTLAKWFDGLGKW